MVLSRNINASAETRPSVNIDDEACRRLMISLYGSEAEAKAAAKALGREITPEEEALIERLYDAGDEIASQTVKSTSE